MSITSIKPGDVVSFRYTDRDRSADYYYTALNDVVGDTVKVRLNRIIDNKYETDGYLFVDLRKYRNMEWFYYPETKDYKIDQEPLEDEECI